KGRGGEGRTRGPQKGPVSGGGGWRVPPRRSHESRYSVPLGQQVQDALEERLRDNRQTPVPEQVCFRLDFPAWVGSRSERDRRIIDDLLQGERTLDVASRHGLSPGRVSQLRREFLASCRRNACICSLTRTNCCSALPMRACRSPRKARAAPSASVVSGARVRVRSWACQ